MRPEHFRLAGLQGAVTVIGAAITYWAVSSLAAKSVVYGGCIAVVSTLLLARRAWQESSSAEQTLRQAYRAAIERFVWVVIMLGAGFKLLEPAPLWLLAGFIGGQAVWLLVPLYMKFEKLK